MTSEEQQPAAALGATQDGAEIFGAPLKEGSVIAENAHERLVVAKILPVKIHGPGTIETGTPGPPPGTNATARQKLFDYLDRIGFTAAGSEMDGIEDIVSSYCVTRERLIQVTGERDEAKRAIEGWERNESNRVAEVRKRNVELLLLNDSLRAQLAEAQGKLK